MGTLGVAALLFAAEDAPLFLQAKQTRASVVTLQVEHEGLATHGERVVLGQRRMQTASDLHLGHRAGAEPEAHAGRDDRRVCARTGSAQPT